MSELANSTGVIASVSSTESASTGQLTRTPPLMVCIERASSDVIWLFCGTAGPFCDVTRQCPGRVPAAGPVDRDRCRLWPVQEATATLKGPHGRQWHCLRRRYWWLHPHRISVDETQTQLADDRLSVTGLGQSSLDHAASARVLVRAYPMRDLQRHGALRLSQKDNDRFLAERPGEHSLRPQILFCEQSQHRCDARF